MAETFTDELEEYFRERQRMYMEAKAQEYKERQKNEKQTK
jgi:hypothetical protein